MYQLVGKWLKRLAANDTGDLSHSSLTPGERDLISRIRSRRLTYLSDKKLVGLAHAVQVAERSGLAGIFVEAGCALGGSTILIASMKNAARPLFVYDVFGMIPAPTGKDTGDVQDRKSVV